MVSAGGMVYGYHTQTGELVWKKFLADKRTPDIEGDSLCIMGNIKAGICVHMYVHTHTHSLSDYNNVRAYMRHAYR